MGEQQHGKLIDNFLSIIALTPELKKLTKSEVSSNVPPPLMGEGQGGGTLVSISSLEVASWIYLLLLDA